MTGFIRCAAVIVVLCLVSCVIEPNPSPLESGLKTPFDRGADVNAADTMAGPGDAVVQQDAPFTGSDSKDDTQTDTTAPDSEVEGPFAAGTDHLARYVWVPTNGALSEGVVIQVLYPKNEAASRFTDGLPVIIDIPGGGGGSGLPLPTKSLKVDIPGLVHIRASFPGEGSGNWVSGGTVDQRGQNTIDALADIVRFALGTHVLADGRTLQDLVGMPIDTAAVGLMGRSNGGNLATVTLATHSELTKTCFLVTWESPILDVYAVVDIGGKKSDSDTQNDADGNGIPWDDMLHPGYTPGLCSVELGCPLDYSKMAFANDVLFRDGNGDGVVGDGKGNTDLNGNGQLDDDEDLTYGSYTGEQGERMYSVGVLTAAQAQGVFADGWPDNIATVEEATAYWLIRSAGLHFDNLANAAPDLHAVVLGSQEDHVQAAPDHPHVWMAYEGFRQALKWVRLNPDASYLAATAGVPTNLAPELAAGVEVSKDSFRDLLVPTKPPPLSKALQAAAAYELADRCHLGVWDTNLADVLAPVTPLSMTPPMP